MAHLLVQLNALGLLLKLSRAGKLNSTSLEILLAGRAARGFFPDFPAYRA